MKGSIRAAVVIDASTVSRSLVRHAAGDLHTTLLFEVSKTSGGADDTYEPGHQLDLGDRGR